MNWTSGIALRRSTSSELSLSWLVASALIGACVLFGASEAPATSEGQLQDGGKKAASGTSGVDSTPQAGRSRSALYVPPSRGRAQTRSGGGTRGAGDLPSLSVLAPDHEGLTVRAQPTVYWFISQGTESRIDFTLIDEEGVEPLLEISLKGPVEAGLHAVRLEDLGLSLAPDTTYAWFVSLVPDPNRRSQDIVSGGAIRRVAPSEALTNQLGSSAPDYVAYASNGIWYDSLSALSDAIERAPGDGALTGLRADLFDQVNLPSAASFDRAKAQ